MIMMLIKLISLALLLPVGQNLKSNEKSSKILIMSPISYKSMMNFAGSVAYTLADRGHQVRT